VEGDALATWLPPGTGAMDVLLAASFPPFEQALASIAKAATRMNPGAAPIVQRAFFTITSPSSCHRSRCQETLSGPCEFLMH
jgi:hypothetical protein